MRELKRGTHHVHNLDDVIALQASMGYGQGETTDNDQLARVESTATEHICTVTLYKGSVTIDCPHGTSIRRFDGSKSGDK